MTVENKDNRRMALWLGFALIILIIVGATSPQQIMVLAYKLLLLFLAGWLGFYMDASAFPYANPDRFTDTPFELTNGETWLFIGSQLRRALIIAGAMLAVSLGV